VHKFVHGKLFIGRKKTHRVRSSM